MNGLKIIQELQKKKLKEKKKEIMDRIEPLLSRAEKNV